MRSKISGCYLSKIRYKKEKSRSKQRTYPGNVQGVRQSLLKKVQNGALRALEGNDVEVG